ncbi:MAG: acetylxylan esterase [Chitinivibrionales bacterium]|nr:acetylxylan esterase [Chitinivibrionales bacterium]
MKGLQALYYQGLPWRGRATRVFAWIGLPKLRKGARCPGMVLVHGGGGTAFGEWVRLWTARGYAAISMDVCGGIPQAPPVSLGNERMRHRSGGPPGWHDAFAQVDEPVADHWPFHAIADIMLARTLLGSLPQVDAARIGITGVSWGGFLTCIVAGVDARFRVAVPVYGCGFLGDCPWFGSGLNKLGKKRMQRWLSLWDPSMYLRRAAMPMLWVAGTNDTHYPLGALQKSYRLPRGEQSLCVRVEMPHGHGGPGEKPEEIRVFADNHLRGAPGLPVIVSQSMHDGTLRVVFRSPRPVVKAEINFTRATGFWEDRKWRTAPAMLDKKEMIAQAPIPDHTTVCYMNLFDDRNCAASSRHLELETDKVVT